MTENNGHFGFVPLMPDGTPAPAVMLEADLIRFLRLEELGIKHPANSLRYYREIGALKPTRISGRNVYTVESVQDFLKKMTKKN